MKIKNITNWPVTLLAIGNNMPTTFEPCGIIPAYPVREYLEMEEWNRWGMVFDDYATCILPEPEEGVVYLTEMGVAMAFPERQDLIYPADPVRDEDGAIVGYRSFAKSKGEDDAMKKDYRNYPTREIIMLLVMTGKAMYNMPERKRTATVELRSQLFNVLAERDADGLREWEESYWGDERRLRDFIKA